MGKDEDANKAVVAAHFAARSEGDEDRFAATHARGGRNHAPAPFDLSPWPAEGKPYGPDEARATLTWLRSGMPDLHAHVEKLIAEGDDVVAWVRMTGTQTGREGPTRVATERAVDVYHAHRFRLRDGLIVEHWAVRDDLRAMLLAGMVQPPTP